MVFVEYRKEDPAVPIKEVHKMSVKQLEKEMNAVGLVRVRTVESTTAAAYRDFQFLEAQTRRNTRARRTVRGRYVCKTPWCPQLVHISNPPP